MVRRKTRLKSDPNYRIKMLIRGRVIQALTTYTKPWKIKSSIEYGIDYQEIINYLKPFPDDITLYHIDHIRPLCSFNFINLNGSTNQQEIKKAFAPENHQWLKAKDNLIKNSKWIKQSNLNKYELEE